MFYLTAKFQKTVMNGFRATAWRTYVRTDGRESLGLQRLRRETKKLDFYGIRGISNLWFKSYLTERKQRVKYKSTFSENLQINVWHLHKIPIIFLLKIWNIILLVVFWSLNEDVGDLRIRVLPSVRTSVRMSRGYSKTVHYFFLKLCSLVEHG